VSAAISPDLVLGYLEQLCPAMEAGAVLDREGRRLAGSPAVADLVGEFAGEMGSGGDGPGEQRSPTPRGELFLVRSPDHQLAVLVTSPVLADLLVHDMRDALEDLMDARP
jgi:hypothetical protein